MTTICPHCHTPQKNPNARFCSRCGQPIAPAAPSTASGPALLIRAPNQAPEVRPLVKTVIALGRAPDNDIVLTYPTVSAHHARLEQHGHVYQLIDLGSTNGTAINGQRIPAHQPQPLTTGAVIRIGDLQGNSISLTVQDAQGGTARRGTVVLDPAKFTVGQITLGRDPQSAVPLASPMVSWHHANIERTPQGDVITDLGSTNGTFVNGQRITRQALRQGDTIQIGPFRLSYTAAGLAPSASVGHIRLDGVHLQRSVKDRKTGGAKTILTDVTLSIQPGEFVAVVGGSGAGKSTLMKALNGQSHADRGQVLLNGDDFYAHFDQYRLLMGYVPQDDIVHRDLPVESALRYAARLRLPPDMQATEIDRRIDEVLTRLDMPDKKKDSISTLSGGQRKRVNIAVEMLADPDLFFLDEPSSGLDPGTEKKLMYDMHRVADSGKTVVMITHATDNIDQCDQVAFMGYGGNLVFFGPPSDALTFFQAQNFADIYLKLNNPQEVLRWRQRYEQSPYYQQYVQSRIAAAAQPAPAPAAQRSATHLGVAGGVRQYGILTRRYAELIARNRFSLFVLLAVMPILGLLLLFISEPHWLTGKLDPQCANVVSNWNGATALTDCINHHLALDLAKAEGDTRTATYMLAGKAQTLLFMMALAASLLGVFGAAYEIVKEKPVYERERMVNLGIAPYLLSKFTVLAGFGILQGLLLLIVIGLKVNLPADQLLFTTPLEMYITLMLTIWASVALGLWVSAVVPDGSSVIYFILLILFVQIIFASVIFELPAITKPISDLTVTRWSLDGLGTSARLNALNQLGKSVVVPDITMTETIEFDVPMVISETQMMPSPTGETPVLVVTGVETETQSLEETIEYHDPLTSTVKMKFQLDYEDMLETKVTTSSGESETVLILDEEAARTTLVTRWLVLLGFAVGFNLLAAGTLKLKERRTH